MENVTGEQGLAVQQLFPYKCSYQMVIKPHSLMPGASNLAILIFLTSLSLSDIFNCLSYSPS